MTEQEIYNKMKQIENYIVTPDGDVINIKTGRKLKHKGSISIYRNKVKTTHYVKTLVATLYLANPNNNYCVRCIDGNENNISVSNLMWAKRNHATFQSLQSNHQAL